MTPEVYLITRYDFDNLENTNPEYSSIEGYCLSESEAAEWIQEKRASVSMYKGWNKKKYPYWTISKIRKL